MIDLSQASKVLAVTTAADTVDSGDGVLSLREALKLAAQYSVDGTVAITFDQSLKGQSIKLDDSLALTTGAFASQNNKLIINGDIDNDGRADVTIDGGGKYKTLGVSDNNFLEVNGIKFINGYAQNGGALDNGANSTTLVSNCEFYDNSARDGGGAIVNLGQVTVVNSLFEGNYANYGGGIFNYLDGETTLINSTLTGNSSGYSDCGGAIMNGWWCFSNDNRISILNSIVAGNTSNGSSCDVKNYSGKIAEMSYSLVGSVSGFTADTTNSTGYTSTENLLNDDLTLINNNNPAVTGGVKCGFTADGLAVYTLDNVNWQYLNGSVYSGSVIGITTDCAGNLRNDGYSIGAFEYDDGSNAPVNDKLIVTTTEDVVDANDGVISLREAIAYAESTDGADKITFAVDGTFYFNSEIAIATNITIVGNGTDKTIFDGQSSSRFFNAGSDAEVEISSITMQNGYSSDRKGALVNLGTMKLYGCSFDGNRSSTYVGAVRNEGAMTIENCTFTGNISGWGDGAVSNAECAAMTILNSVFTGNSAKADGGAVTNGGTLTIAGSLLANNTAGTGGGAICNWGTDAALTLINSTITSNKSSYGGAIFNYSGAEATVVNSTVVNNTGGYSSAISTSGSTLNIVNNIILGNNISGAASVNINNLLDTNATISETFAELDLNGKPQLNADGTIHIKAEGLAAGTGVYIWHNADYSAIAYSETYDGQKTAILGNAADAVILATDQLGNVRGDNAADKGAVVLSPGTNPVPTPTPTPTPQPTPLTVTTTADVVDANDGVTSLREAVAYAATLSEKSEIKFNIASGDTVIVDSEIALPANITIDGSNLATGNNITIKVPVTWAEAQSDSSLTASNFRVFSSKNNNTSLNLQNLTLQGGKLQNTNEEGGALYILGTSADITVDNCVFSNSATATGESGGGALGIELTGDLNLTISDSAFRNNYTDCVGGAINIDAWGNVVINIDNTDFVDNAADCQGLSSSYGGGAIWLAYFSDNVNMVVRDSIFAGNSTANSGGAINTQSQGNYTFINTSFTGNKSDSDSIKYSGSAVYVRSSSSNVNFINSTVTANNGNWCVVTDNNQLNAVNSIFSGNYSNSPTENPWAHPVFYTENNLYSFGGIKQSAAQYIASLTDEYIDKVLLYQWQQNGNGQWIIASSQTGQNLIQDGVLTPNRTDCTITPVLAAVDPDGNIYYSENNGQNWKNLSGADATVDDSWIIKTDINGNSRGENNSIGTTVIHPEVPTSPLTVNTLSDVVDANDGVTSLREAVAYAATLPGVQTVTFAVNGTIELNSSLKIVNYICIDGSGFDVTIQGAASAPVFAFTGPEMTLKNLTVASDYTGSDAAIAGIKTNQYIYLSNVKDSGSAQLNWSVEMRNSELHASDSSRINKVQINANTATWGTGAVKSFDDSSITGLIINGQQLRDGGDLEIYGHVYNAQANDLGDVYIFSGGTAHNTTVQANGYLGSTGGTADDLSVAYGGLFCYDAQTVLTGSIVIAGSMVGNISSAGSSVSLIASDAQTDVTFDLSSWSAGGSYNFKHAHHNYIGNKTVSLLCDDLQTLDNATCITFVLKEDQAFGSYAIGKLNGSTFSKYSLQVGSEVYHDALTIGGFWGINDRKYSLENVNGILKLVVAEGGDPLEVNSTADTVNKHDNLQTICEALAYAQTQDGVQTISFNMADGDKVTVTDGTLIDRNVAFDPVNAASGNTVTVELKDLEIANRSKSSSTEDKQRGGAVMRFDDLNVQLTGGKYTSNRDSGVHAQGGAFWFGSSNVTIDSSSFSGNYAFSCGGAVFSKTSDLTISNAVFDNNSVTGFGGAILLESGSSITLRDTVFTNNRTGHSTGFQWNGGAISLNASDMIYEVSADKVITNTNNDSSYGGFLGMTANDEGDCNVEFRVNGTLNIGNGDGKDSIASLHGIGMTEREINSIIRKTGSGTMIINAPTSDYNEEWSIEDGVLAFTYAQGGDFADTITISGGQLQLGSTYSFTDLVFKLNATANELCFVNDLSKLTGGVFTIDGSSAAVGSYKLAGNAAAFNGSMNLLLNGENVSLKLNQAFIVDNQICCTLQLNANKDLVLDIATVKPVATSSLTVTTAAAVAGNNLVSLSDALSYAQSLGGNQTILFDMADGNNVALTDASLLTRNITFANTNAATGQAVILELKDLEIANRRKSSNTEDKQRGGAVMRFDDINVKFTGGKYTNNRDSGVHAQGGAFWFGSSNVTIDSSSFSGNYAFSAGGAILGNNSNVLVKNAVFDNNEAVGFGGAMLMEFRSSVTIEDTVFTNNSTGHSTYFQWNGGAISLKGSDMVYSVSADKVITNTGNDSSFGGFLCLEADDRGDCNVEFKVNGTLNIGNGDGKDSIASLQGIGMTEREINSIIRKTGSGTMIINAPTADYNEEWSLEDGILAFTYAQGGDFADTITISGGQLQLNSIYSFKDIVFKLGSNANTVSYVNDLSKLTGGTLSVDVTQAAAGTYRLASGAADFGGLVSIYNNGLIGALAVGSSLQRGDMVYTLNQVGDTLTLAVKKDVGCDFCSGNFSSALGKLLTVIKDKVIEFYKNGSLWNSIGLEDGWDIAGVGDFNNDGIDDILRKHVSGLMATDHSDGQGGFSSEIVNSLGSGWSIHGTGDFDGDGVSDVLLANPTAASKTVGLLGYWKGGKEWTLINGYSSEWELIATGDYNSDGKSDMLWKNSFSGADGRIANAFCTWIMDDANDWRMVSVANYGDWEYLASGDFDGDNCNDIAMINGDGVVGIWGVKDGYLDSWSILSAVDTNTWQLAGVDDFNNDGTDDIAWCNVNTASTGYWQINNKNLSSWQNIATIA
ncbi:MAG: hypothetical protein E7052_04240 [Lentisphaerae bacterium]|nr:hypothetical protein [Lentisphaerota bacterium]